MQGLHRVDKEVVHGPQVHLGKFKKGSCNCSMFQERGTLQMCPKCILEERAFVGDEHMEGSDVEMRPEEERPGEGEEPLSQEEKKEWEKKLRLIHGATGHGSTESLVRNLRQKGVRSEVIELAKRFVCDTCEERKRPAPRRVANLELVPKRWAVALADCAFWRHPHTKKRVTIGLLMDQGSRFLVGRILMEGEKGSVKADQYTKFYQENWQQYFGSPDYLRFDAEGAWRSRELDSYFSRNQVMLDPIPGDAHWHLSPLERSIEWLKELLSRIALEDAQVTSHEAVAQAISIWNRREMVRGFSPFQHAMGQAPDIDGRFFRDNVKDFPVDIMETPVGEIEKHQKLRLLAEETFLKWQARERIARALNSKSKPFPLYSPGELVFYWRHLGRKEAGQRYQTGHFYGYAGPARILALETRFDEDNNVRPSSVVWLVRNNRLLKGLHRTTSKGLQ